MKSSDTAPNLGYPKPKISLVDLKPPPPHLRGEAQSKHMADQLGMTVEEMRRYLADLPKR
ncbi:MAG TPA: hypothetical protein DDZ88_19760 [Verrucomicrobiales bacterium]|nr:hypothetical protein [Verrucomicrobiales bacterium]